jgi:dTMP kinase
MDTMTEALLVFAARRDHVWQVIEPALARGEVVLCDRFTDSTFAYQGGGQGFDLNVLSILEQWVQSGRGLDAKNVLQPDLTLWFDLLPAVAAQRLAGVRTPDKFEAKPVAFFERVAQGYAHRAAAFPARFARVDAANGRDAVWQDVLAAVQAKGWLA